jgi:two-component system phosphate regulon sensor histidine kinase PhoR
MSEGVRNERVTELLLDAARIFGETLDPEAVYDRFHELLARELPHDGVVVSSLDGADMIHCEYAWSEGARLDAAALPLVRLSRTGGGMQSRVYMTGEPLLENDVGERVKSPGATYYNVDAEGEVRRLPESGPTPTRAMMMVPVRHAGQVVGVVQAMKNDGAYSLEDLALFDAIVAQLAASVRNARLHREREDLAAAEAAARAVAAERAEAANVLGAVADGVALVDARGILRFWNSAAERITGKHDMRERPVEDVFDDWAALEVEIPVAETGADARPITVPATIVGRDLWLSVVAVRTANGIAYAFRDVTNEQRLEQEKSDFIATISHELRTPMASVFGAAQTLLREDIALTEPQRRALLEMIGTQAERLALITEEVLLATQLDRGLLTVEQAPVDLPALVQATTEAMRSQLDGADIRVEVAGDVEPAAGAPERIQQVLANLLTNAVKYGSPPVDVRVEPSARGVRLIVRDSGPGIAADERERIFEKFYRGGSSLTRSTGGTGLGLYISRELVRRMRGRLELRSRPGEGAEFTVELPRAG